MMMQNNVWAVEYKPRQFRAIKFNGSEISNGLPKDISDRIKSRRNVFSFQADNKLFTLLPGDWVVEELPGYWVKYNDLTFRSKFNSIAQWTE